jgi:GGDEF domain-containing protein
LKWNASSTPGAQKVSSRCWCTSPSAAKPLRTVTRQVAEKLVAQFRPSDRVSRWSPTEFLVLFDAPVEIAERRAPQVVAWLAGSYDLPGGAKEDVTVELGLLRAAELFEAA